MQNYSYHRSFKAEILHTKLAMIDLRSEMPEKLDIELMMNKLWNPLYLDKRTGSTIPIMATFQGKLIKNCVHILVVFNELKMHVKKELAILLNTTTIPVSQKHIHITQKHNGFYPNPCFLSSSVNTF